jgi:hyperosmotically inducible periplasmic protein
MNTLGLTGLSALVLFAAGCSNTVEGLKKDAEENKVQEKTEKAAEAVASAVQEAGHEIKAKTLALQVKTKLMAEKGIDASHVHVETDDDARTLTLTGSVPTAAQKEAAGEVARGKASDYRVRNLLTVGRS